MPRYRKFQGELIEVKITERLRKQIGEGTYQSIKALPKENRREALEKAAAVVRKKTVPLQHPNPGFNTRNLDKVGKRLNPERDLQKVAYQNKAGELVEMMQRSDGRYGAVIGAEPGYKDTDFARKQACTFVKKGDARFGKNRSFKRKKISKEHIFPDKPRVSDFDPRNKYGTDPTIGTGRSMKLYKKRKQKQVNQFKKRQKANEYAIVVPKVEEIVHLMVRAGGKKLNQEKCFTFLMREYGYSHCDVAAAWRILWSAE